MKQSVSAFLKNLQLIVFAITYTLSSVLVLWLFIIMMPEIQTVFYFLLLLMLVTVLVIYGSYLYVLFSISQKMPAAFDRIKNRVSLGVISNEKELSEDLFRFLTGFFDLTFMDVRYAALKAEWAELLCSSEDIESICSWKDMDEKASCTSGVCSESVSIGREKYYAYTVPIWFEGLYLGYFTVFLKHRLGKARKKFLLDLEEFFIDDLLIKLHPDKEKIKLESTK